jgi:chromosome segregation ATPase
MSEDLTKKLPKSDSEILLLILTTTQKLEVRFGKLEIRVENIDTRLQSLEKKVEERLHDTRPIWQKLVVDIAELQESQKLLHTEVREIRTSQRDALRRMSLLHETLFAMQADYRDIYDRVRGLETNCHPPNSST